MTSKLFVNSLEPMQGNTINVAGSDTVLYAPGHIIQVVTYKDTSTALFGTTSASYVTNGDMPAATITPKFSNSKILIQAMIGMQSDQTGQIENTIYRTTGGVATDLSGGNTYGLAFKGVGTGTFWAECSISWSDNPNTTNAVEYKWYSRSETAANIYPIHVGTSVSMTLMEVAQ